MERLEDIQEYIYNVIKPNNIECQKEEMFSYVFSTQLMKKYENVILPRLRNLLQKICNIIYDYYKRFTDDRIAIEQAITVMLTCDKCKNTGAVSRTFESIKKVIEHGNIRELFFLFDEFIHNGCIVMSWLLYTNDIDLIASKYQLSEKNILEKLKYVAEVISGSKQELFNNKHSLESFIRQYLGTKYPLYDVKGRDSPFTNVYPWEVPVSPSMCSLWNMQDRTYNSHKLLYELENQRYVEFPKQRYMWIRSLGDASYFKPPSLCYETSKNYKYVYKTDKITNPPLSFNEISYLKKNNRDIDYNKIINWKGGCCYSYVKPNTVSYEISKTKNKPRITSYSGHVILEFELLSLFDTEFDQWKELYMFASIATMLPYCHHSTHEILTTVTYWGIKYNIDLDFYTNFFNIINNADLPQTIEKKHIIDFMNDTKQSVDKFMSNRKKIREF